MSQNTIQNTLGLSEGLPCVTTPQQSDVRVLAFCPDTLLSSVGPIVSSRTHFFFPSRPSFPLAPGQNTYTHIHTLLKTHFRRNANEFSCLPLPHPASEPGKGSGHSPWWTKARRIGSCGQRVGDKVRNVGRRGAFSQRVGRSIRVSGRERGMGERERERGRVRMGVGSLSVCVCKGRRRGGLC